MRTLSFVVLSYNYGRFLGACLESILRQHEVQDFEVIVVDDASTDNSTCVAQAYVDRDARVRLVRNSRNFGHAVTVTTGLRLAQGDYIARIDCDDRYRPTFARQALRIFASEPDVGLVYGDAALVDEAGEITQARSNRAHGLQDFKGRELAQLLQTNFICAPTVIARREVWLNALPIPDGLAFHDWYFTLMAARQCEFYYTSQVVAEYRVHATNFHKRIVRDRTEEPSIFRLLDAIYAEPEATADLELAKQRVRRRAYAAQYLTLADKYFGFGMDDDARRCYLRAVVYRPSYILRPDVARHLGATLTTRRPYGLLKSLAMRRTS